jgi:hypothetical protein
MDLQFEPVTQLPVLKDRFEIRSIVVTDIDRIASSTISIVVNPDNAGGIWKIPQGLSKLFICQENRCCT